MDDETRIVIGMSFSLPHVLHMQLIGTAWTYHHSISTTISGQAIGSKLELEFFCVTVTARPQTVAVAVAVAVAVGVGLCHGHHG